MTKKTARLEENIYVLWMSFADTVQIQLESLARVTKHSYFETSQYF